VHQALETQRLAAFLFTDVVSSVGIKQRIGDSAYRRLMDRHDDFLARALTSPALARNDFGDGFLVVLSSVTDAVNSALRFLAVLRDDEVTASLGVRIGIHLGDLGGMNEHTTGTQIGRASCRERV